MKTCFLTRTDDIQHHHVLPSKNNRLSLEDSWVNFELVDFLLAFVSYS